MSKVEFTGYTYNCVPPQLRITLHREGTKVMQKLVTGIKGPADFAVVPNAKGLLVVVPDLVQGELRFVQLGK
jgi:hypothetical protein